MIKEIVTPKTRLSESDPTVRIVDKYVDMLRVVNNKPHSLFMLDQQLFCYLGEGRRSKTFLTRSLFDGMQIVKVRKNPGTSFVEEAALLDELQNDIGVGLKRLGIVLPAYGFASKDYAFMTYYHGRPTIREDFGKRFDEFKSVVDQYRSALKKRPRWTGKDLDLQEHPFNSEDFITCLNGIIAWVDPIALVRLYGV